MVTISNLHPNTRAVVIRVLHERTKPSTPIVWGKNRSTCIIDPTVAQTSNNVDDKQNILDFPTKRKVSKSETVTEGKGNRLC
jgi:hypothetical protein